MIDEFISCDWGTSSLRLRLVCLPTLEVLGETRSDDGAARVQTAILKSFDARDDVDARTLAQARAKRYEELLETQLAALTNKVGRELQGQPIVVSGMATSTIGWRELPYGSLPLELHAAEIPVHHGSPIGAGTHPLLLISGLRDEADVLRGEEAEILGILHAPDYEHIHSSAVLVLPGTHSKHVRIKSGAITHFRTFMTGELFEVMACHSILRNSVTPETLRGRWWETDSALGEGFSEGVSLGAREPLSGSFFSVRARQVLEAKSGDWCAAYLSGILIGSELASATANDTTTTTPVLVSASGDLRDLYHLGCSTLKLDEHIQFATPEVMDIAVARGQSLFLSRF